MDSALRQLVRERAKNHCEYCRLHQNDDPFYRFHIEYVLPRQHGGEDTPENLALGCYRCNLSKGTNLTGIDPFTGEITRLFHPRRDIWSEHFDLVGTEIIGLTPIGRTTVRVLKMNSPQRMRLRATLALRPRGQ